MAFESLSFSLDGQLPAHQAARHGPATPGDSDTHKRQPLLDAQMQVRKKCLGVETLSFLLIVNATGLKIRPADLNLLSTYPL